MAGEEQCDYGELLAPGKRGFASSSSSSSLPPKVGRACCWRCLSAVANCEQIHPPLTLTQSAAGQRPVPPPTSTIPTLPRPVRHSLHSAIALRATLALQVPSPTGSAPPPRPSPSGPALQQPQFAQQPQQQAPPRPMPAGGTGTMRPVGSAVLAARIG